MILCNFASKETCVIYEPLEFVCFYWAINHESTRITGNTINGDLNKLISTSNIIGNFKEEA